MQPNDQALLGRIALCSRRSALVILSSAIPVAYLATCRNAREIPFLITVDVHGRADLYEVLSHCLDRLAELQLTVSFFVPGRFASENRILSVLRRIVADGHQLCCHGFRHDGNEDYYTDSFELQRRNLTDAKQLLESVIGRSVTAFRAPAFRVSKETFQVLENLGFKADLSVCSQRLPLLSSQIGNYHWLFAPRLPYHPRMDNPYAKGDLKLLEIPTSSAVLPLMSTLSSVSVLATKAVTATLKREAEIFGNPIVYQCHPEDFVRSNQPKQSFQLTWRSLVPSERYGVPARWAFQETEGHELFKRNQDVVAFFKSVRSFRFVTVDAYMHLRECRQRPTNDATS